MKKVVVKILQGSVVTQRTLGGLTIYPRVANFLQCIHGKNYENWLAFDKVIVKIIRLSFFGPTLYCVLNIPTGRYSYCISPHRPICQKFDADARDEKNNTLDVCSCSLCTAMNNA